MINKIAQELKLTVVNAKPSHLPFLGEIQHATTPRWYRKPYLREAIRKKRAFVAMQGRIPCGVLVWTNDFYGHYFIDLVAVHPEFRGKGAAMALIRRMETLCRGKKLFTSTNRSNKHMQHVLRKAGYVKAGFITHLERSDPEWVYYKKIPE